MLKMIPRASGHASLTCTQSISLPPHPPGCSIVQTCRQASLEAALPLVWLTAQKYLVFKQKFCLLTTLWADSCKELQWDTETHTHTPMRM